MYKVLKGFCNSTLNVEGGKGEKKEGREGRKEKEEKERISREKSWNSTA